MNSFYKISSAVIGFFAAIIGGMFSYVFFDSIPSLVIALMLLIPVGIGYLFQKGDPEKWSWLWTVIGGWIVTALFGLSVIVG